MSDLRTSLGGIITCALCLALGCTADERGRDGMGAAGGSYDNPGLGGAGIGGGNSTDPGGGATSTPQEIDLGNGDSCGGDAYNAEGKELEIFVLFDNSVSMAPGFSSGGCYSGYEPECNGGGGGGGTGQGGLWEPAVSELKSFINDSGATGIGVGLKYFGAQCDPGFYANPDVPIGKLPTNAGSLNSSLDGTNPDSETATRPALEGAIMHVQQRLGTPDNNARIAVLLVTDGLPDEEDCSDNSTRDVADVAADGMAAGIPTYVLGLGASNLDDLRIIAEAGGTGAATLVDVNQPGVLADVMNDVRNQELAALPCDYAMPSEYAQYDDPDLVNLTHNGAAVGRVDSQAACDPTLGGWYFDNPQAPTRIHACGLTCDNLRANNSGSVNVTLGCPVVVIAVE